MFYILLSLEKDTLTSTYFAFFFFDERPGLAPLLKGRKLNERPGAHLDNYGIRERKP